MERVELLAPAGNLEKLKMAVMYGADSVYIGGREFGLRAFAENFSVGDMIAGIEFAHGFNKKVYLTLNIIPHNEDIERLPSYIKKIGNIGLDGIIVSDPGIFALVREIVPRMEIHMSTQANNTNWKSAEFWYKQGAGRIILARELSIDEISKIRQKAPEALKLEAFVHGSMCISYSGRCLLSSYMTGRDSNLGMCAHPCRWNYYLAEEKRPGEYYPVYEDERGTYIMNSKDLCMIQYLPEILKAGITSLKIEGRNKSVYYVATIVKAYREALDAYFDDPGNYKFDEYWLDEVKKVSHRDFTTGFFLGRTDGSHQVYETSSYIREYDFIGIVKEYNEKNKLALIEQRNRFSAGDIIEVMPPKGRFFSQTVENMTDEKGYAIDAAPHPQMKVYIKIEQPVQAGTILRKQNP